MRPVILANVLLAVSSAALAANFDVQVGGDAFVYTPNQVVAQTGDTITFHFNPKNHSVTQSSFDQPCVPLPGGKFTPFVPVAAGTSDADKPTATFTVDDSSAPLWFFCAQTGHCQSGMVFAVNPGNKFAAFQAAAMGSSSSSSSTTSQASQTASGTETTTGSQSTSTGASHLVTVGDNGMLAYSPSSIQANVGDTITFEFRAKNHTATQSTFAHPCDTLASTSTSGQVGFDSGFMPVASGVTSFPQFTITVNDTNPIWVYCQQTNPVSHCNKGMVFAANAPSSGNTFQSFQQAAMNNGSSTSTTSSSSPSQTGAGVRITSFVSRLVFPLFIFFVIWL